MEVLLVYGLVLLFFILVPLFVILVLSTHPYTQSSHVTSRGKTGTAQTSFSKQQSFSALESKIAYGALAVILLGLCLIAVLGERRSQAMSSS